MAIRASLPKGTRDFGPEQVYKRNYIFNIIREVFEKYGFQPLETPAMENLATLTGKYGDEGDKLLFRILNSGDFLKDVRSEKLEVSEENLGKIATLITEKGLRYDLTVPFARYVVQHQHEITFPFKRYQMQPVWRADRPQRGRYREFYQCDVDVVGSDSLLNEVEMAQIYLEVFHKLGIDVTLKINNRKILFGFVETLDIRDKLTDFTVALDKLDKIGIEGVMKEFEKKGIPELANGILDYTEGTNAEQLSFLKLFLQKSEAGMKGVNEIEFLLAPLPELQFNMTLARGLDYYTGIIFEVQGKEIKMGSLGGGGRYDDLTGVFGLEGVSGTGISFGVERIYDVMEELNLFENINYLASTTKVLFINFGDESENTAFQYLQQIRNAGISSELYPSAEKMKKQMKYADAKKIPYVIFIGEDEMASKKLSMKNMKTGEQKTYKLKAVIELLKR